MKRVRQSLLAALVLSVVWTNATIAQKKRPPNPAYAKIEDDPSLPRVLLIGDSISIGYTVPVREILKGKANLHRIPTNGGPTIRGVASIDKWLGDSKWDVIHFNWGLHDLKQDDKGKRQVPIADYEKKLTTLVKRLKKTGATLIWANTTPVPEGKVRPTRDPADVVKYNEVAEKIMKEHDVQVNDLYTFALPKLKSIQRPVNVHFTPAGSKELAKEVSKRILQALNK